MKKSYILLALILFVQAFNLDIYAAPNEPIDNDWQIIKYENWKRSKQFTTNNYFEIFHEKNSKYITVGEDGLILTSDDGFKWDKRNSSIHAGLSNISWNGRRYVVLGSDKNTLYSDDGVTWKSGKLNYEGAVYFKGVCSNGKVFVAVGSTLYLQGLVFISNDGINWNKVQAPVNVYFSEIKFKNGYFIARSDSALYESKDGIKWTYISDQRLFNSWSYDGKNYKVDEKIIKFDLNAGEVFFDKFLYVNNRYIALDNGEIKLSTNGEDWESVYYKWNSSNQRRINDIIWDGEKLIGVGIDNALIYSYDFKEWKQIGEIGIGDITDMNWDGTRFMFISLGETFFSYDGENWEKYKMIVNDENVMINGSHMYYHREKTYVEPSSNILWDGKHYFCASRTELLKSKDGVTWEGVSYNVNEEYGFHRTINKIIWDGHKYIMIGSEGLISISYDAINWKIIEINEKSSLVDIEYNGKNYLISGRNGVLLTSSDGVNWIRIQQIDTNDVLANITWNGNQFSVNNYDYFWISKDLKTWDKIKLPVDPYNELILSLSSGDGTLGENVQRTIWTGNEYIMFVRLLGGRVRLMYSKDGINWNKYITSNFIPPLAIESNGTRVIMTGVNSSIYVNLLEDIPSK
jgi:hypothetical protein